VINTSICAVIWIFKQLLVLVLKSISNSENHQLQFFEKTESKNHQSWLFQKPQRTCGFHERTVGFYGLSFYFIFSSLENCNHIPNPGLWIYLRIIAMNPKNHLDNHQESVPVSINDPTLVNTGRGPNKGSGWRCSNILCIFHVLKFCKFNPQYTSWDSSSCSLQTCSWLSWSLPNKSTEEDEHLHQHVGSTLVDGIIIKSCN